MTSLIINMPHLQTRRQRHGAVILSAICWAWFLMPLVIVGGWLMGFRVLAQEVVWLGGWQSLVGLGEFAVTMIATLICLWTAWTLIEMRRSRPRIAPVAPAIDAAAALGADPAQVADALSAGVITVHFAADGNVAAVVGEPAMGQLPVRQTRGRRAA